MCPGGDDVRRICEEADREVEEERANLWYRADPVEPVQELGDIIRCVVRNGSIGATRLG